MIEIKVKKTDKQGQHKYALTQTIQFESMVNGKVSTHSDAVNIAHFIATLRIQHGFSWEDVESCVKIEDKTNHKSIAMKDFIDHHKELIMQEEKAVEKHLDMNKFMLEFK